MLCDYITSTSIKNSFSSACLFKHRFYHPLADIIMSRVSLLFGEKALLDEYNERVAVMLNAKSSAKMCKPNHTVGLLRGIEQMVLDTDKYNPDFSYVGKYCTTGALFEETVLSSCLATPFRPGTSLRY